MEDEMIIGDEVFKEQGVEALMEMGLLEDEAERQFEDMYGY